MQVTDAGTSSTTKVCFAGTHRVCTAEETLRNIRPVLSRVGITRLADVTWLDDVGIPVFQAIRPGSRLLSVSQGKGLSSELAKVSAAMESIEAWHAERLGPGTTIAVGDMAKNLDYEIEELDLVPRHALNDRMHIEWSAARRLDGGGPAVLPTALLRLDARVVPRWTLSLFNLSTNGLASGNTFEEAAAHGLYELIERDAVTQAEETKECFAVPLDTVDGSSGDLLEQFARANVDVQIFALPGRFELPCFRVKIWSDTFPVVFAGYGCHRDRDVSLCRALTEAAQSRVTAIAGTRDDMSRTQYRRGQHAKAGLAGEPPLRANLRLPARSFRDVASTTSLDIGEDLRSVTARVKAVLGRDPLVFDHTRPDVGVAVAHVVCPRMRFDLTLL